jgi:hypothetical protein
MNKVHFYLDDFAMFRFNQIKKSCALKGRIQMKKYVIGLANLYENTNELHVVEANNPIEAMCKVLETDDEFNSVEEVKQYAFDGDMLITEPLELI